MKQEESCCLLNASALMNIFAKNSVWSRRRNSLMESKTPGCLKGARNFFAYSLFINPQRFDAENNFQLKSCTRPFAFFQQNSMKLPRNFIQISLKFFKKKLQNECERNSLHSTLWFTAILYLRNSFHCWVLSVHCNSCSLIFLKIKIVFHLSTFNYCQDFHNTLKIIFLRTAKNFSRTRT